MPFSELLAKYLQPAMLQLNLEGTTDSKFSVVEHPAHKTKALILLLQETHCICVDKLVIPNFAHNNIHTKLPISGLSIN